MKAIQVMFDSLRKDLISAYGGPIPTPNFERLLDKCAVFGNCYVGSLPCMPARREMHTGRYNFLHRSWGPVEPFDDSMPQILAQNGVHSHIVTDHYHYIQDGGATYMGRYSSWECYRGQESDQWQADLTMDTTGDAPNQLSPEKGTGALRKIRKRAGWQNMMNRETLKGEEDYAMHKTFSSGLEFMEKNASADNWFLTIETFDPHEPFTSPDSYQGHYLSPDDFSGPDWPQYAKVSEDGEAVGKMRGKYFALVEFCDERMGKVLDKMDELDLWKDTMLIVNTDHGFFLSEHGWWGKGSAPDYNELVNIPFFVYDPRFPECKGRKDALVQTIDIAPTILEFFNLPIPASMLGKPLRSVLEEDGSIHDYALFGYLGSPIGVTDGRYVLLRDIAHPEVQIHEYTLMPTHMKSLFSPDELKSASLSDGFSFTKGCPVLKIDAKINPRFKDQLENGDELYDLSSDPGQLSPIKDEAVKARLLKAVHDKFVENEAPEELYLYYGV